MRSRPCLIFVYTQYFPLSGIATGIPLGLKIPCVNKSLRAVRVVARQAEEVLLGCNHRGDS